MINPLLNLLNNTTGNLSGFPASGSTVDPAMAFAAALKNARSIAALSGVELSEQLNGTLPASLSAALPEEIQQLLLQTPGSLEETLAALANEELDANSPEGTTAETGQAIAAIAQWLAASQTAIGNKSATDSQTATGLGGKVDGQTAPDANALQQLASSLIAATEPDNAASAGENGSHSALQATLATDASRETSTSAAINGSLVTDILKKEAPAGSRTAQPEIAGISGASAHTSALQATTTADAARGVLQIQSALGSDTWQNEFDQHMLTMALRGDKHVSLHLNPRDLGPLVIDLKMSDNQAHLHFLSSHQQVRSAVEDALPHLRQVLDAQGITLGDTSVSHQGKNNGQEESGKNLAEVRATNRESSEAAPETSALPDPGVSLNGRVNLYI